MRLRTALVLLAAATGIPLLILFIVSAGYVYRQENQSIIDSARARNRATLEAMDGEIRGTIGVLQVLATSQALTNGDLAEFYASSKIVLATQPTWQNLILLSADGRQLTNPRMNFGDPLPQVLAETQSLSEVVATGAPAIGNLAESPYLKGRLGIPVRVPVARDGQVKYVLTAVIRPEAFGQILTNQLLPAAWTSGVVGADGRLIARVPTVAPGTRASEDYLTHIANAPEGWYRGKTLEGTDTYTAFSRSKLTGWSIGYAIPSDVILGDARRSVILWATGMLISALFAFLIGGWVTRRIAQPIAALVSSVRGIGTEAPLVAVRSTIVEVAELSMVLYNTTASIRERDALLSASRIALEQQSKELQEKSAHRTRFLALLSHELRNPMAPLRTGLSILQLRPSEERRAAVETMMLRQLAQLTRLVDDLLDIGRIETGRLELKLEPTNLHAVVKDALEATMPLISAQKHAVKTDFADADIWVSGDAARLQQVVGNLLTNAAKYTMPGGTLDLRLAVTSSHAMLSVADTGIGFEACDRDRIFEMFTRLSAAAVQDAGGLGIGLSLASTLVQLHHGELLAASDGVGRGATFTVLLPLIPAPARRQPVEARASVSAAKPDRVLVADDNIDAANTIGELLRLHGFEVDVAYDGTGLLKKIEFALPSVVFLDLNMPGTDGWTIARQIRATDWGQNISLIALTGKGQANDRVSTADAGFDMHLVKPADGALISKLAAMTRAQILQMRAATLE